ncbi:DNA repair protein RecO [Martelella endophytica]|uniref:DNA repair protein RecO n=1 Tax=Martelella endophytica TaxID=1486262 RepID=A0A0D5LR59_MAREN|nr:DNA repair protein RecO [Martelella endophytica]AJY46606.1 DNA recombination protein RecO [Martelella endophytica]
MEWQDEGIVLGVRRHGETSVIAEVMTAVHGRHLGLVRGGRSRTLRPVLQPGNRVALTWRARLSEHLGEYRVEPLSQRAALLMQSATALYGVQAMAALLRLLPERDPHGHLLEAMEVIITHLDEPESAGELYVRFELALLNELGFGLDLEKCAASGSRLNLAYVSPKTGRAVSRDAGAPYADRMLSLPPFLRPDLNEAADAEGLSAAFRLTAFFLDRHVFEPRGLKPDTARDSFVTATLKALA